MWILYMDVGDGVVVVAVLYLLLSFQIGLYAVHSMLTRIQPIVWDVDLQ